MNFEQNIYSRQCIMKKKLQTNPNMDYMLSVKMLRNFIFLKVIIIDAL